MVVLLQERSKSEALTWSREGSTKRVLMLLKKLKSNKAEIIANRHEDASKVLLVACLPVSYLSRSP